MGGGGVYSALVHVVFVVWVCLRETWVIFRDDPQYNVMKYLVFGIISVVYYQSYKLSPSTVRGLLPLSEKAPEMLESLFVDSCFYPAERARPGPDE